MPNAEATSGVITSDVAPSCCLPVVMISFTAAVVSGSRPAVGSS